MFSWCPGQGPALSKILARIEMIRPYKIIIFCRWATISGESQNRDQSIDFVFPYKAFAGHGISEPVHKAGPEFGIVQK